MHPPGTAVAFNVANVQQGSGYDQLTLEHGDVVNDVKILLLS